MPLKWFSVKWLLFPWGFLKPLSKATGWCKNGVQNKRWNEDFGKSSGWPHVLLYLWDLWCLREWVTAVGSWAYMQLSVSWFCEINKATCSFSHGPKSLKDSSLGLSLLTNDSVPLCLFAVLSHLPPLLLAGGCPLLLLCETVFLPEQAVAADPYNCGHSWDVFSSTYQDLLSHQESRHWLWTSSLSKVSHELL